MSDSLTVVLTVAHLAARSGLSLYVRDVATELHRRGHRPIVYASRHDAVARELRALTIPVPDSLDAISVRPDIIHGHNYLETLLAVSYFWDVPAVQTCHGWASHKNGPLLHPRVRRYLPVDDTCRDRVRLEHGVPDHAIETHLNFVDMQRFRPREPLPARPARAFVFSSKMPPDHLQLLRDVSAERNIVLDVLDAAGTDAPETILPKYDLVFARGRCALEAMAVGAALVICGREGLGPLVTTRNFARLRELNFGMRALRRPVTREAVTAVFDAYDALDAMNVAARIRAEAGLETALDALVDTYRAVIRERLPDDRRAEGKAIARYVDDYSRLLQVERDKQVERLRASRKEKLRSEVDHLRAATTLSDQRRKEELRSKVDHLRAAAALNDQRREEELRSEVERLRAAAALNDQRRTEELQSEMERLRAAAALNDQRRTEEWRSDRARFAAESHAEVQRLEQTLQSRQAKVGELRNRLEASAVRWRTEAQRVRDELKALRPQHRRSAHDAKTRQIENERLRNELLKLQKHEHRLTIEVEALRGRGAELERQSDHLTKERNTLRAERAAERARRQQVTSVTALPGLVWRRLRDLVTAR